MDDFGLEMEPIYDEEFEEDDDFLPPPPPPPGGKSITIGLPGKLILC